jgi:membrane-bound metal-dependent hydrolase YbcI (DUF457 family)
MDTITHGIVGALVGKALFAGPEVPAALVPGGVRNALGSPTARAAIVSCTLGAIFPDIDIFAGPLAHNPLSIMEWHRNITHSAVLLPVWALLLTALAMPLARRLKWKSPPFLSLYFIFAAGLATHVFLDVVTNFGTMVWSPVNYDRASWDWIFIVDFSLTAIALVPQLAAWCYREPYRFGLRGVGVWVLLAAGSVGAYWLAASAGYGFPLAVSGVTSAILAVIVFAPRWRGMGFRWTRAGWCRAGLALVCVYMGLAAAAHRKALADVKQFAAERHLQTESLAALPLPPTLTHWVGLVNTGEGVWRAKFFEPSGTIEETELYADAQSLPFLDQAMKLRDVQTYLWFARFPVWRVVPHDGNETAIEISDVRFFRERDPFAAPLGVNDPPNTASASRFATSRPGRAGFTFEILFDAQGHVLSHGFKEPE